LKAVKRDIVMVSVSASGQTGPERGYAGYAPLFGAAGGLGTLTGYEDGPPTEIRHVMDHSTGLTAAMATLAAYLRKKRTGAGQHVDVAARDVACGFIGDALLQFAATGIAPRRTGNDAPQIAPHNVYPCAGEDSWVSIVVSTDTEWRAFANALERPALLTDPRFASAHTRWVHRRELDTEISAWTHARTREAVTRTLQAAGVAAFPSYTAQDIVDDPHLRARGMVVTDRHPVVGPFLTYGNPIVVPGEEFTIRPAPAHGEHTDEVLMSLGYGPDDIAALHERGVV